MGAKASQTVCQTDDEDNTAGPSNQETAQAEASTASHAYRLLLVGKTGSGKSATGNNILNLNEDVFKTGFTDTSVTMICQCEYSRYQGQVIKVVDMPGLSDSSKDKAADIRDVEMEAGSAVAETPEGYDAILVVVQCGRQSREDKKNTDILKDMFGENFIKEYGILVVTRGDDFRRSVGETQTFEEYCSQQKGHLKTLWNECNKRAVLFDNATDNEEIRDAQRRKLFEVVDALKRKDRYTPRMFEAAKAAREKMLKEAEELVLTDEIKSTLRLMMHDLNNVKLETANNNVAQLEDIKTRAQQFIAKTQESDNKVKKKKKVLKMAETIEEATKRKIQLANLRSEINARDEASIRRNALHEPGSEQSSSLPQENNLESQIKKLEEAVKKDKETLEKQYQSLIEEDISMKEIITLVAVVAVSIGAPLALGAIGGLIASGVIGAAGRTLLTCAGRGAGIAAQAIPFGYLVERFQKWRERRGTAAQAIPFGYLVERFEK